jgi:hypothetical protein
VRNYGQFCPIARASEILAEQWTPVIIRTLLLSCTTCPGPSDYCAIRVERQHTQRSLT